MRFSISVRTTSALSFWATRCLKSASAGVIYHQYPKLREGQLTRKRAALVCEANPAKAATRLGLGSYLKLDRRRRGCRRAGKPVDPCRYDGGGHRRRLSGRGHGGGGQAGRSGDGRLQNQRKERPRREERFAEYLQALGEETPTYEIIGQDGPPHARMFYPRGFCVRMAANWARARARANSAPKRPPRRWRCKRCIRLNETRVRGYGKGSHRCG